MRTTLLLWACLLCSAGQLCAQPTPQTVVNSAGKSFSGSGYQVDWSLGEMALVNEMRPSNGQLVLTNGFLQPFLSATPGGGTSFTSDEIQVLPNHTYDNVDVKLLISHQSRISMALYDATGKVLLRRVVESPAYGQVERFSLGVYASGTYVLRVYQIPLQGSKRKTGSYKIIRL